MSDFLINLTKPKSNPVAKGAIVGKKDDKNNEKFTIAFNDPTRTSNANWNAGNVPVGKSELT